MYTKTITNPKTGRQCVVRCWEITPRAVLEKFKSKQWQTAKDVSYALLDDDASIQTMRAEDGGNRASNNFALSVFENALDWGLGLAVVRYIDSIIARYHKLPKPFEVVVNRAGDVFIVTATGRIL